MQETWLAHFYRKVHGDAGYKPLPIFPNDMGDIEKMLEAALLERFADPRPTAKAPHTVDLVNGDGKVVLRLYAVDRHSTTRAILKNKGA